MNVKELIEVLQQLPQEAEVIIAKDPEGNGYSPLSNVADKGVYVPETTWRGEVYSTEWTAEEAGMDDEEWEQLKFKHVDCILLEPVN